MPISTSPTVTGLSVSNDGRFLLYAQSDEANWNIMLVRTSCEDLSAHIGLPGVGSVF